MEAVERARSGEREWWLRALLVVQSPRAVFAALRDDSDEARSWRGRSPCSRSCSSPGSPACCTTSVAGRLLDDSEYDVAVLLVCLFVAGGVHGFAGLLHPGRPRSTSAPASVGSLGSLPAGAAHPRVRRACRSRCRWSSGRSGSPSTARTSSGAAARTPGRAHSVFEWLELGCARVVARAARVGIRGRRTAGAGRRTLAAVALPRPRRRR